MKFANAYTNNLIEALYHPVTEITVDKEKYERYKEEFNKSLDTVIEKMVNNTYKKSKTKIKKK